MNEETDISTSNNYYLAFNTNNKEDWIRKIVNYRKSISKQGDKLFIRILLYKNINITTMQPMHIVLLACFLEYLKKMAFKIEIIILDDNLKYFLLDELQLCRYFNEKDTAHIETKDESILNLWKIINNRTEEHSLNITRYLERTFFKGYDISGLKNAIDETYYNIADHSQSDGIAYSYIKYNHEERKIHVAACDFGLGIPCTLKNAGKEYKNDEEALKDSLEIGVTAQTTKHNRGFGLDNIVSNLSNGGTIRIVSNEAILFCKEKKNNIKTYPLEFDFKGTLIYFDISIDSFDLKEVIEDVTI